MDLSLTKKESVICCCCDWHLFSEMIFSNEKLHSFILYCKTLISDNDDELKFNDTLTHEGHNCTKMVY